MKKKNEWQNNIETEHTPKKKKATQAPLFIEPKNKPVKHHHQIKYKNEQNLLIWERTREHKPVHPRAFLLPFSLVCSWIRTKITALRQDEDSGILRSDWGVERVRGTDGSERPPPGVRQWRKEDPPLPLVEVEDFSLFSWVMPLPCSRAWPCLVISNSDFVSFSFKSLTFWLFIF